MCLNERKEVKRVCRTDEKFVVQLPYHFRLRYLAGSKVRGNNSLQATSCSRNTDFKTIKSCTAGRPHGDLGVIL
jgi:hypothetical protein